MNEEIINKALELRMVDLSKSENVLILANAYQELFGKQLCLSCGGDIRNAYYKLNSHFNNPNAMKLQGRKASLYKLKTGAILIHPVTSAMYSNINLTDEIAKEILELKPTASARFEVMPTHIAEVVEEKIVEQKPKAKKKNKKK